jgi:hypothetical protein
MPQADLIRFFTEQGLTFDPSGHKLYCWTPPGNGGDFIDNLQGNRVARMSLTSGRLCARRVPGSCVWAWLRAQPPHRAMLFVSTLAPASNT